MKKAIIFLFALFALASCEDLTELNVDKKNPESVPAGTLFANSTVALFDFMTETNVNVNNFRLWAQHWAQTTYPDESNYELVERNVNGSAWNTLYATVIRDLREARAAVEENVIVADHKRNQLAIISILETYAYHVLVDIFGDIPYTSAFTDDVTPAYDDDATIYASLMDRLDQAIGDLSGESGFGGNDLVYNGDVTKWRKFANSLKLRMAIRLADSNSSAAQAAATAAVSDGVILSNADNFTLQYQQAPPHTNPLWVQLVQSGRTDFIAANTLADYMNERDDPRRSVYFTGPMTLEGDLIGGAYGDQNTYSENSQPGTMLEDPTMPGTLLDAAEVHFLLADAVSRGFNVGGTAEGHYNAGVKASFDYWGLSEAEADAYLATPMVAYSTAPGADWKEKIAMQKWLALYNRGFEAWTTYRLYDAPEMNIAVQAGIPTPNRYTYPVTEYSLNEESVRAASSAIGSDALSTRVFWDMK